MGSSLFNVFDRTNIPTHSINFIFGLNSWSDFLRFSCNFGILNLEFKKFGFNYTLVEYNLKRLPKRPIWRPCVVVGSFGTTRWWKNFLIIFQHIFIMQSHFFRNDAIWRGFQKRSILASLGDHRYFSEPPDGRKYFFNRLFCILHRFKLFLTSSDAIWKRCNLIFR